MSEEGSGARGVAPRFLSWAQPAFQAPTQSQAGPSPWLPCRPADPTRSLGSRAVPELPPCPDLSGHLGPVTL